MLGLGRNARLGFTEYLGKKLVFWAERDILGQDEVLRQSRGTVVHLHGQDSKEGFFSASVANVGHPANRPTALSMDVEIAIQFPLADAVVVALPFL